MEGARTRDPIANIHGIVKFEYQYTRDIGSQIPRAVWTKVEPNSETTTIKEQMSSGNDKFIYSVQFPVNDYFKFHFISS
jgi:hypothetical protein